MRVQAISTVSSLQPRALLLLLLLSGGILLSLSAVIERPHDTHGVPAASDDHGVPAASDDHSSSQLEDHGTPEGATTGAEHAGATDSSHASASEGTQEAHGAADANVSSEVHDAGTATVEHDAEEPAPTIAHGPNPPTMLGINLDSLNLVSPRLAVLVVGLTLLSVPAILLRGTAMMFAATIGLSLFGLAACSREALHAGEELGIFVPLPILAAVLYAGAGALAGLQIVTLGTQTESPHHAHA
jgi:hypothetical protein